MSPQEQHEIIGRTVIEHGEAKRRLAALRAKAAAFAGAMRAVAQDLAPVRGAYTASTAADRIACGVTPIIGYPDMGDVVDLRLELQETVIRVDELETILRDMGVQKP